MMSLAQLNNSMLPFDGLANHLNIAHQHLLLLEVICGVASVKDFCLFWFI